MTMFIKLDNGSPTGHPITEQNFKGMFKNISFPRYFTHDTAEHLGYGIYEFSDQPEVGRYQKVVEITPVRSDAGIWRQTWQLVDISESEKAEVDATEEGLVRARRGSLLAATDWAALSDTTLTAEMAAYRQALRDITDHVNFPYLDEADWPVKP